jgi:hypothetical protein
MKEIARELCAPAIAANASWMMRPHSAASASVALRIVTVIACLPVRPSCSASLISLCCSWLTPFRRAPTFPIDAEVETRRLPR